MTFYQSIIRRIDCNEGNKERWDSVLTAVKLLYFALMFGVPYEPFDSINDLLNIHTLSAQHPSSNGTPCSKS